MQYTDEIHKDFKSFTFPPLIEKIIEHDLFQRLKKITQLGCASMCFPNANHTRYEHCIGTYWLARKMLTSLSQNSNNFEIPEFYKNCVCIAALLHDIGHGPFSHFWEKICENYGNKFEHEENCKHAVDKIFQSIHLKYELHPNETIDERNFGIELIKALITGKKCGLSKPIPDYEFLFDIVNNKCSDIDVDKWDYLLRDYYYSKSYLNGVEINLNFDDVFTTARISLDKSHIEYNAATFNLIYDLFDARFKLHINLYQHQNVKLKEILLLKALDLSLKFSSFQKLKLFEMTSSDENFTRLTDDKILKELENMNNEEINKCLEIWKKEITENTTPDKFIIVNVENPGEKMNEDRIKFYGNFSKTKITPKKGFFKQKILI